MEYRKLFFALLIIFSLTTFNQSIHAQITKKKPRRITKAEYYKREVKRFVAAFIKALDETKDLSEMPKDFFVKDFKSHQTRSPYNFLDYDDELKKLSADEQFEHQISFLNFYYLGSMWNGGGQNFASTETEFDTAEYDFEKILPIEVVETLKESPVLVNLFNLRVKEKNEEEPIKSSDLTKSTVTIQNAANLLKISIENREPGWKELYAKNIKMARKRFSDYRTKFCKGDECFGFPEKTHFFWQSAFPLYLGLVKENDKFKIFCIAIYDE